MATAEGATSAFAEAYAGGAIQVATAANYAFLYNFAATSNGGFYVTETPLFTAEAVGSANVTFANTGTFTVNAEAVANGANAAEARAFALGVGQIVAGDVVTASFLNDGHFEVHATASASAPDGLAAAAATAVGYALIASGGTINVRNTTDTSLVVLAVADATGATTVETANAIGITILGVPFGTGTAVTPTDGFVSGTITNTGTIDVRGIANGGTASATGIVVSGAATVVPPAGHNLIITNDAASILAAFSVDGGATFARGMAIDVSLADVGSTLINLFGEGSVYGHIDLAAADDIVVDSGETEFDGIINPEFDPQPSLPRGGAPQGVDPSPAFDGTLTINPDGSLFLVDDPTGNNFYDGPSFVYIGEFSTTGNIAYELRTAGAAADVTAHYPQVFANTANLGGTLEVRVNNEAVAGPLLYDDEVVWEQVIEADVLNGEFDGLVFDAPGPLINIEIVYPPDAGPANVDLRLTRTPFGDLGGETPNQAAVGAGIEAVYDVNLTGPFAELLAEIFTLDEAQYFDALDQLSGIQYLNFVNAVRNNSFVINSFVSDQIDCAIELRGVDECRAPEDKGHLWVMGTYNWASHDTTDVFIGYDANSWSGTIGGDVVFGDGGKVGAFAGYRDVDVDNDPFDLGLDGGNVQANGWQLGIYAAYDPGQFYIRGIGSYSMLNGDSERLIDIGNITGTASGDFDANVWSFYAEAGGRFDMGGSWLTPFVAIDHTSVKFEEFSETGVPGANLEIDGKSNKDTIGLVGLKWAGNFGGIIPEAKIAYRHDFDEDTHLEDAVRRCAGGQRL